MQFQNETNTLYKAHPHSVMKRQTNMDYRLPENKNLIALMSKPQLLFFLCTKETACWRLY